MKKILLGILKFAIPLAIIGWLLATVDREQLRLLTARPKNWPMLAGACSLTFTAVCLTFVRWFVLVRALHIPFRLRDAFRLGFLGYLFNFVGAGSVGGDLFKAVFIAHEQPGKRAESVATVLIDRIVGLYALLLVASSGILAGERSTLPPLVAALGNATLAATAVATLLLGVALMPGLNAGRLTRRLTQLPKIGPLFARMAAAARIYRTHWRMLIAATAIGVGVHLLLSLGIFLAAASIFETAPSLREHLTIVPMSMVAGALPITPAGLGTFEVAMEELYKLVPAEASAGDGIIVAMVYRLITIVVAALGFAVYGASRNRVAAILHEAEAEQNEQPMAPD